MEVVRITPRGYCHGVVDAVRIAKKVAAAHAEDGEPIYMLGYLVHNEHVTTELQACGVQLINAASREDGLEQIEHGTVIFTAHGVSPTIVQRAHEKGLTVVDATCSDVTKTHDLIDRLAGEGLTIIYVGKRGHPEPEGSIGHANGKGVLVESIADVDALSFPQSTPLAVTCQTTLSVWDTQAIIDRLVERYPDISVYNEICLATQDRQEAAVEAARQVDGVVVVGSSRSSNSLRLVQVVEQLAQTPAILVDQAADIDPAWFVGKHRIGVTAGASTPTHLTREVIDAIEAMEVDTER